MNNKKIIWQVKLPRPNYDIGSNRFRDAIMQARYAEWLKEDFAEDLDCAEALEIINTIKSKI